MAYLNHALTVCSFLAFLLVIGPLPWHLKAWNTATCVYIFWCGLGCLIYFINTILYDGTTEVKSAIWCEMSARLLAGASYGIPAATLAINRRLYIISRNATTGMPSKTRIISADIGIALFMPGVLTALISLPQGHRSNLLEDIGCVQPYHNTVAAITIQALPPVVIGLVSGIYGALNVYTLYKRQTDLKRLLAASSGQINIDFSEYYRLFCLGLLDAIFTIPLSTWLAHQMINEPLQPWIWDEVKYDYHLIWIFPRATWEETVGPEFRVVHWLFILCALTFFAFFGCNQEARERYTHTINWVGKYFCNIHLTSSKSLSPLTFPRDLPTSRRVTQQPHPLDMTFNSSLTTLPMRDDHSAEFEFDRQTTFPDFTFGSFSVENLGFSWNRSTATLPPPVLPLPTEHANGDVHISQSNSESSLGSTARLSYAGASRWSCRIMSLFRRGWLRNNSRTKDMIDEEKAERPVL